MRKYKLTGCIFFLGVTFSFVILIAGYLYLSSNLNILILGLDARENEGTLGRTDTMIITTFDPIKPYSGILSIPRDLWVTIPRYGENRINTAHFFAESENLGDGPQAAVDVVEYNFGVDIDYYLRIRFDQLKEMIDDLGGVDLYLLEPMSGYSAGEHHLNGEQVLTFVRDRSGSDDFFRMERGQLILKSLIYQYLDFNNLMNLPSVIEALITTVDSNIPMYIVPKIAITLLRAGFNNLDYRIISREMVSPFTTDGGAAVLAPNWSLIQPLLIEVFGQ